MRHGDALEWTAPFTLPDGGRGRMELKSIEDGSGVHYSASVTAETDLAVSAIEFVVGIPRAAFLNGKMTAGGGQPISIGSEQPRNARHFFSGETSGIKLQDEAADQSLDVSFDHPLAMTVVDRWDAEGRFLELRGRLRPDEWRPGTTATISATLQYSDTKAAGPVRLTDGFVEASAIDFRALAGIIAGTIVRRSLPIR